METKTFIIINIVLGLVIFICSIIILYGMREKMKLYSNNQNGGR